MFIGCYVVYKRDSSGKVKSIVVGNQIMFGYIISTDKSTGLLLQATAGVLHGTVDKDQHSLVNLVKFISDLALKRKGILIVFRGFLSHFYCGSFYFWSPVALTVMPPSLIKALVQIFKGVHS